METRGEESANKVSETKATSGQRRKKRRKSKLIGTRKKSSSKRSKREEEKKVTQVPPNKTRNVRTTAAKRRNDDGVDDESSFNKEPTKRINELISEEDKKEIESYYYLDLTFVDKRKVKKNIFHGDKIYRCKLCQTAYPRLDKCQVGFFSLFFFFIY